MVVNAALTAARHPPSLSPLSLLPFVFSSFTRQKRETDLQEMQKAAACKHPSGFHSDRSSCFVSLDLVSVDVVEHLFI